MTSREFLNISINVKTWKLKGNRQPTGSKKSFWFLKQAHADAFKISERVLHSFPSLLCKLIAMHVASSRVRSTYLSLVHKFNLKTVTVDVKYYVVKMSLRHFGNRERTDAIEVLLHVGFLAEIHHAVLRYSSRVYVQTLSLLAELNLDKESLPDINLQRIAVEADVIYLHSYK
jgi:hypothetical protein